MAPRKRRRSSFRHFSSGEPDWIDPDLDDDDDFLDDDDVDDEDVVDDDVKAAPLPRWRPFVSRVPALAWKTQVDEIAAVMRASAAASWPPKRELHYIQFPPTWEHAQEEKIFSRPYMTIWAVPVDDTATINTGYLHISDTMEVSPERLVKLKLGDRLRVPVRLRPLLDGLAAECAGSAQLKGITLRVTTGRGTVLSHSVLLCGMLRNLIRDGIRAVQAGRDPQGVAFSGSRPISTFAQDTVLRVPPAATPEAEKQLLIDIGRRVLDGYYVKNPPPGVVVPSYALVGAS